MKNQGKQAKEDIMEKNLGITIISLVITIVVLLILAGITIGTLTGENGIINNSKEAKTQTEIANEKEVIDKSSVEAMGRNKRGNLEEKEFQEAMDSNTKEGDTEVTDIGEEFEVYFNASKRVYTVDKNGSILDYEMAVTDPYPGDITKDENGEILNGEDKPYQINCIEDLVEWSKNYTKYQESNIILCRNLDFGSKTSYADSKRTDFGNINGDEITESLIEELQKEKGFPGIKDYEGIFDGQGYKISNLYRNNAGGLLDTNSGTIKKLDIDVELYLVGACGGLCSTNNGNIEEVKVYGKIESISTAAGGSYTGAICFKNSGKIVNSYNYAPIKAVGAYVGGISGQNNGEIEQCKNEANIVGLNVIGGISGLNYNTIRECANTGNISTYNNGSYNIAGISAVNFDNTTIIENCYNLGDIGTQSVSGFNLAGIVQSNPGQVNNCYSIGTLYGRNLAGIVVHGAGSIQNCFYVKKGDYDIHYKFTGTIQNSGEKTESQMKETGILELLNTGNTNKVWGLKSDINNGFPYLLWEEKAKE